MAIIPDAGIQEVQVIARREVDRHKDTIVGITASAPQFVTRDNGKLEYVVDVRVGAKPGQGLVKEVLIASWAEGLITDFNIPVIIQRSESGQLTIVARAVVRLPDVRLTEYNYGALGIPFAANLVQDEETLEWSDGFGYPASDPNSPATIQENWEWQQGVIKIDDIPDEQSLDATTAGWVQV